LIATLIFNKPLSSLARVLAQAVKTTRVNLRLFLGVAKDVKRHSKTRQNHDYKAGD
jgi:hypothetical protein